MRILTGIDLGFDANWGSINFFRDLYSGLALGHNSQVLEVGSSLLTPVEPLRSKSFKGPEGAAVDRSTSPEAFVEAVRRQHDTFGPNDIVHIHYPASEMARAFCSVQWNSPLLAICHGIDIISSATDSSRRMQFQRTIAGADKVIFPTVATLDAARTMIDVPESKAIVMPWGIPDGYLMARPAKHDNQFHRIVFAGRLLENKGVDVLLQALALLDARHSLSIIGSGPARPALLALADDLKILDRIAFEMSVGRATLRQRLSGYQVAVVPSRAREDVALVALEAQSAGLPLVHSLGAALSDELSAGELAFPCDDAPALATKIEQACSSVGSWREYSRQALASVSSFPMTRTRGSLYELSRHLVRRHHSESVSRRKAADGRDASVKPLIPSAELGGGRARRTMLEYDESWLQAYDSVTGNALEMKEAEMKAFERVTVDLVGQLPFTSRDVSFLDIGTCTGRYLKWARRMGFKPVIGIDIAEPAVWHCQRELPSPTVILRGSILDPGVRPSAFGEGFDLVTMMFGTVNHFTIDQQREALRTLRGCLSDDGCLVVSSWRPGMCRFGLYGAKEASILESQVLTEELMRELGADVGLKIVQVETTDYQSVALLRSAA